MAKPRFVCELRVHQMQHGTAVFVLALCAGAAHAAETPVNLAPLSRFDAKGDGVTDDSAALQRGADFVAANGNVTLVGEAGKVYVLRSGLVLRGDFRLDLHGAMLKPTGSVAHVIFREIPKTVDYPVLSGLDKGSTQLVLQSSAGLQVGSLVRLTTKALGGRLVPSYRNLQAVVGNQVDLGAPLVYRYPSPTVLQKVLLQGEFSLKNGVVDGSAWSNATSVVWIGGYANVVIEGLTVQHAVGGTANWVIPQTNRYVRIRGSHFLDNSITVSGEAINVWDAQSVDISDNEVRGNGFGITVMRADQVLIKNNTLYGDARAHPVTSVRGIKVMALYGGEVRDNTVTNYANAIRTVDSGNVIIYGNTANDSSPGDPTSYAIAVSNQFPDREHEGGNQVLHNLIRGSGGSGIYLGAGSPGCTVEDNEIQNVGNFGIAIFTDSPGNHTIRHNTIRNFDQANRGAAGIYIGAASVVQANTISDDNRQKPAIHVVSAARSAKVDDNQTPNGNPVLRD